MPKMQKTHCLSRKWEKALKKRAKAFVLRAGKKEAENGPRL